MRLEQLLSVGPYYWFISETHLVVPSSRERKSQKAIARFNKAIELE